LVSYLNNREIGVRGTVTGKNKIPGSKTQSAEFYTLSKPIEKSILGVKHYVVDCVLGGHGKHFHPGKDIIIGSTTLSVGSDVKVKFKDEETEFKATIKKNGENQNWYKTWYKSSHEATNEIRNSTRANLTQYYIPNAGDKILKPQNNLYLTDNNNRAATFDLENFPDSLLNIRHLDENIKEDYELLLRLLTNQLTEEEQKVNYSFVLSNHLYILRRLRLTDEEIENEAE
jgi:hypothetical protein